VYGKIVESRFHYVAEEGAKEVKATVYDLQGNTESISWDVEPAVIVGDGPSVSILSITPSDTTPDPGETITLSVSTRNDGIAGTADIGMTVIDPSGDACDLQWKEAEYTVGETKTLVFLYEVPSETGWYKVISKSWNDCSGDCGSEQCCDPDTCECVGEQKAFIEEKSFIVGTYVSIPSVTPSDTTPDPGETITLSVSTWNDGSADTADIGMTVIDPSGDVCDLQWQEAEYTVGETKTLVFLYEVPSERGGYNVISKSWDACTGDCGSDQCCDPDTCECAGEQDGLTKLNAFDVVIPEGPDLTLTSEDISFSDFNPAVGEVITITAVIHNIGTENANKDVIVQFFDGDPATGGIQIGDDQVIGPIAAGGAKSTQIDCTVNSITNVYVKVDPYDDIKEMNEGNNVAHRLVSIAISPEVFIDTLNKIIAYQNEISAYVGDNSDEMLELAFIYAIPYPVQDKEKKEQLEEKIIKNIPKLEIEQEQQKFENFYIFLDDIKEGEVITFTPDEKGTKVKVGDNSEYLVEDVYFDIPYDKITLEKEAGKISLTRNSHNYKYYKYLSD
jgi:hypothetical protein